MRDFDLALRLSAACLALPRATFHARLHVRRSCYASFSVSRALDLPPLVRATPAAGLERAESCRLQRLQRLMGGTRLF